MYQKRPLTFTLFSMRLLSGIIGGTIGILVLFIVYFIMNPIISSISEKSSLSAFVVIVMTFVGTISANTSTALIVSFMDNEKYNRRRTIVTHVFLFNLILFLITIPLYLMAINLGFLIPLASMHFLLSAFVSSLIMEILAGREYSLLGIYGSSLAIFISITLAILMINSSISNTIVMFASMPMVWLILELVGGLTELIYDAFVSLYGIDALDIKTDLGGDTEAKQFEENEITEE